VYGPGDEHLIALGLAAGVVVVGGAAIIATGGTATPLVAAGAKGAFEGYQAYQARGNLEARRVALGLGATAGAIALINNSSNSSSSSRTTKVTPCFEKKTIYD
jgi:hypothetical protein